MFTRTYSELPLLYFEPAFSLVLLPIHHLFVLLSSVHLSPLLILLSSALLFCRLPALGNLSASDARYTYGHSGSSMQIVEISNIQVSSFDLILLLDTVQTISSEDPMYDVRLYCADISHRHQIALLSVCSSVFLHVYLSVCLFVFLSPCHLNISDLSVRPSSVRSVYQHIIILEFADIHI